MKKRRHHFVWRKYLEAWAHDGVVTCLQDGRIFAANPLKLGVKKDFYRLRELSSADLKLIRSMVDQAASPGLREMNHGWLPIFTTVFRLKQLFEERGIDDPELLDELDTAIQNTEEDLHGAVEADSARHLAALRQGDLSFLNSAEDRAGFFVFLALQQFRTLKAAEDYFDAMRTAASIVRPPAEFNHQAIWPVLRHVLATNVGYWLHMNWEQVGCVLFRAQGTSEFITTDQPVMNLSAIGLPPGTAPDDLRLLFPVSPQLALIVDATGSERGTREEIASTERLERYNSALVAEHGSQVYARDALALERFLEQ